MHKDRTWMIRSYRDEDLAGMIEIWNAVVRSGDAFPQDSELTKEEASHFFASQSATSVAVLDGKLVGLYILHPNNVGRCAHIANASYCVGASYRGKGIGKALVLDSMEKAKILGFRILQFNAVLTTNQGALHLYHALGFEDLGVIQGGFAYSDGSFVDIQPMVKYL
ncbi:MAG: GNAT family N-acetyltransferase [Sphaerochaeta sp.]|nr:GNAT family N-acetyltransferase [Sphaerochaeta sp.]